MGFINYILDFIKFILNYDDEEIEHQYVVYY